MKDTYIDRDSHMPMRLRKRFVKNYETLGMESQVKNSSVRIFFATGGYTPIFLGWVQEVQTVDMMRFGRINLGPFFGMSLALLSNGDRENEKPSRRTLDS